VEIVRKGSGWLKCLLDGSLTSAYGIPRTVQTLQSTRSYRHAIHLVHEARINSEWERWRSIDDVYAPEYGAWIVARTEGDHIGGSLEELNASIDTIAHNVKERIDAFTKGNGKALSLSKTLALLHGVLYDELGYGGNTAHYYDAANSFLPLVISRRRGIPISLAVLYMAIARRIGLCIEGVNAPGHFLLRAREKNDRGSSEENDGEERKSNGENDRCFYIDAFEGKVMDEASMRVFLAPYTSRFPVVADTCTLPTLFTRMYRNLINVYDNEGPSMYVQRARIHHCFSQICALRRMAGESVDEGMTRFINRFRTMDVDNA
jgi:hypothetical protein